MTGFSREICDRASLSESVRVHLRNGDPFHQTGNLQGAAGSVIFRKYTLVPGATG